MRIKSTLSYTFTIATYTHMVRSNAETVEEYLSELPADRRVAITTVRDVILKNLPAGYEEIMQHGMIAYVVPLERYPDTYNGRPLIIAALASQKSYMSLYLSSIYADKKARRWFMQEFKATGNSPDMGKSCVRFKNLEDFPLKLVGRAIAATSIDEFIKLCEKMRKSFGVASLSGKTIFSY